ncbi:hypothetical protein HPB48_018751 [Haemaphysalis longicornis]|uniref:Uncharacterized protein n=1 Tax=Haemaphysalis longicornis TaxID=44386 RepID=A0A9J6GRD0_HAELO|nr:hypothetical protein HPB48_018751 [Haemaphysalis longicornis]
MMQIQQGMEQLHRVAPGMFPAGMGPGLGSATPGAATTTGSTGTTATTTSPASGGTTTTTTTSNTAGGTTAAGGNPPPPGLDPLSQLMAAHDSPPWPPSRPAAT